MSGVLAPQWLLQALTDAGAVASGALLSSFVAGGGNVPSPLYADKALTTPLTNPYQFNSAGRAGFWLDPAVSYRLRLETATGGLLWEQDGVEGSAAAKDTVQTSELPYVTLEQYGAAGDGSGNDYPSWQLAMIDLANGGTLRLAPNKTYAMDPGADGRLDTADYVQVIGAGPSSVIYLTATESERGTMRIRNGGVFRDFRIDGPSGARQSGTNACGITGLNSSGASIERVEVSGVCSSGINMQGATGYLISDCYVHDTMADGIHNPKSVSDFVIQNCRVYDTVDDCISVVGYRDGGATVTPTRGRIIGNRVKNGAARGITVIGGDRITVLANTVTDCQAAGIMLNSESSYDTWAATNCVVAYNTFDKIGRTARAGQTGTYNFTISVRGRASQRNKNIKLIGNTITDSSGINATAGTPVGCNAISVAYTDGIQICGNVIDGTPTGAYALNTLRWLYVEQSTDIEFDDNECNQCTQIGAYLASTVTGKVRITRNKLTDNAMSGSPYSVIYSDSSTASLVIESNEEDHPTGTPDYFLNLPSGTDAATFSLEKNDTTLESAGTVPENLPYAQNQSYDSFSDFPALGSSTKTYLARDTGRTYYANDAVTLWTSNASSWDARGICAGPDGCLYMCVNGDSIYRGVRSGSTVTWTTTGAATGAWRGICMGSDGCLYATVSNAGAGTAGIWRGSVSAGVVTWSNVVTTAQLWQGITAAPGGVLYAVVSAGDVYRGPIVGSTLTMTAMSATSREWRGIEWHPTEGALYATVNAGSIYRIRDAGGTALETDLSASASSWRELCIGPDGHLAIAVEGGLVYQGIISPSDGSLSVASIGVPSANRWGICTGQDLRLHMTIVNNVTQRRSTPYQVVR